ncbi:hypothetical protein C3L57_07005 [Veillonellaceae bacterium M2-8]|nr:hypothetical protein [Veillonellaceae bacterium M2-8]
MKQLTDIEKKEIKALVKIGQVESMIKQMNDVIDTYDASEMIYAIKELNVSLSSIIFDLVAYVKKQEECETSAETNIQVEDIF